jgi:deazaflavin-dependent oxidoreductase (nitroreductase family)
MTDWDPEAFTRGMIADMRANNGAVTSGPLAGETLLILTTTGARSGKKRQAIVTYTPDGDRYLVAASAAGSPKDPGWFHNLVANPTVEVEASGESFNARAEVVGDSEHATFWHRHVAAHPAFAEYPEKAGRVIPMIILERID